jgi:carboxymethylenebutenolidase
MTPTFSLSTSDGPCTVEVAKPATITGPWPAVIVCCDGAGVRPAQRRIAERIAAGGYIVFQPDLFHRSPPITKLLGDPPSLAELFKIFATPDGRAAFMTDYYAPAVDYKHLENTIGALLDHITGREDVRGGIGTTGYCMGGNVSVRIATLFGDRITATASFHPGGLVTDQPESPHLRASQIKSRVYLAPSIPDLPAEAEAKLRASFDAAGVRYELEQYPANHGYAVDDSPAYDATQAERHYKVLAKLFAETL